MSPSSITERTRWREHGRLVTRNPSTSAYLVFVMQILEKAFLLPWTDIYAVSRGADDVYQREENDEETVAHGAWK